MRKIEEGISRILVELEACGAVTERGAQRVSD